MAIYCDKILKDGEITSVTLEGILTTIKVLNLINNPSCRRCYEVSILERPAKKVVKD